MSKIVEINPVLHLNLKRKWYDMIDSGVKKEEYREIKQYWVNRLCKAYPSSVIDGGQIRDKHNGTNYDIKKFSTVVFKNGYTKDAKTMIFNIEDITIGVANKDWCDDWQQDLFIIKLGKRIIPVAHCHLSESTGDTTKLMLCEMVTKAYHMDKRKV